MGLVPGWGRSPGGGNGSSLHYSSLVNPIMGRGAWQATAPGMAEPYMTAQLVSETGRNTNSYYPGILLQHYHDVCDE